MIQEYNFPDALKGDTYPLIQFTALNVDSETGDRTPIDLTGADIRMWLKTEVKGANKEREFNTNGKGITITNAVAGEFVFDKQIIDVKAGNYIYDMQFWFPDNTTQTYLKGRWCIVQDVTEVQDV